MSGKVRYIKFMKKGCIGPYSGAKLKPNEWLEAEGKLQVCFNGFHTCTPSNTYDWLDREMYTIESDGEVLYMHRKQVHRRIRMTRVKEWNRRTGFIFLSNAADMLHHEEELAAIFKRIAYGKTGIGSILKALNDKNSYFMADIRRRLLNLGNNYDWYDVVIGLSGDMHLNSIMSFSASEALLNKAFYMAIRKEEWLYEDVERVNRSAIK